jgi:hypothetical protein
MAAVEAGSHDDASGLRFGQREIAIVTHCSLSSSFLDRGCSQGPMAMKAGNARPVGRGVTFITSNRQKIFQL